MSENRQQSLGPMETYLEKCAGMIEIIRGQSTQILDAAKLFSRSILADRCVHIFASGHSRMLAEEMWPRYGSFPGFNPIVELSLTFHNLVVGANGQRQAMFLENVSGLAERILRNFGLSNDDSALVISSSGTTNVAIEMAEQFKANRVPVVVIVSRRHADASESKRSDGKKLTDFADIVLDTGAPAGDAVVAIPGLDSPVGPASTVGGAMLINALKCELARLLVEAGKPPTVLTGAMVAGRKRSEELFERAYDEHAHLMARLYDKVGR